jgi:hypothetical protein
MIDAFCSYCGSGSLYVPTEQTTTVVMYRCLTCGALMNPNMRVRPDIYKQNPITGDFERIEE